MFIKLWYIIIIIIIIIINNYIVWKILDIFRKNMKYEKYEIKMWNKIWNVSWKFSRPTSPYRSVNSSFAALGIHTCTRYIHVLVLVKKGKGITLLTRLE